MNAFSRYFDSLVAPLFKTDAEGRTLYFPAGVLSNGRRVPDAATADMIRSRARRAYMVMFLVMIPALVVVAMVAQVRVWVFAAVAGAIMGVAQNAYLFLLARGLPKTQEKMSIGDAYRQQASALGRAWLTALLVMCAVFAVVGMAMIVVGPGDVKLAGLGVVALFGSMSALFAWQRSMAARI